MIWLQRVLDVIVGAGLTINRQKSEFSCEEVKYLGYMVNQSDLKTLRRFLGIVFWYWKYIKDFATIVEPLFRLLKKNRRFVLGEEQQKSFKTLKVALISTPTLAGPDIILPFILQTRRIFNRGRLGHRE
ncbi:uncharacterized mitochondrial protein AtMg00860-like [Belonocnema kinseyi]|uniref:uncharacterized mitochondrial protein AtMg00860-like n=1 Tax=Belonocnema kinseyi TaxID=2817044 RepID=UPI00143DD594|nr:uncharacterized mitochondrial protein AtMg00860-like [Belonocnema kinseyi]